MTPQQRERLNRFLAEKVMGWELDNVLMAYVPYPTCRLDETVLKRNWNPVGKWADCEPLLDKIEQDKKGWRWETVNGEYVFFVKSQLYDITDVTARSTIKTEALCLAIARAYGWEEDV